MRMARRRAGKAAMFLGQDRTVGRRDHARLDHARSEYSEEEYSHSGMSVLWH